MENRHKPKMLFASSSVLPIRGTSAESTKLTSLTNSSLLNPKILNVVSLVSQPLGNIGGNSYLYLVKR